MVVMVVMVFAVVMVDVVVIVPVVVVVVGVLLFVWQSICRYILPSVQSSVLLGSLRPRLW